MHVEWMFYTIPAVSIGIFLFRVVKYGGFKAAMFGAQIQRTEGEVVGLQSGSMRMAIQVHRLGGDKPERTIGLELIARDLGDYRAVPVILSASEARKLATLLQSAADPNVDT